ncbi:hypothetical protein KKH23_04885 [Patescibacteria group bacterium]|nr:hypothetical protein [Patescibacteria group bacterium]MBU1067241.1 hypothetical protein [Patescibacteria group bacterium]
MARKLPRVGQLVRVTWVDSRGYENGWVQRDDMDGDVIELMSVGWVWHVAKDRMTLAPHMDVEQTQACGTLSIPWCAVREVLVMRME